MPEVRLSKYKEMALGSIYLLEAFQAAELMSGAPSVLSTGDLCKWVEYANAAARTTLEKTKDKLEQIRTWAKLAVQDGVLTRVNAGGGRAVGGGGRHSDYKLSDEGRKMAQLPSAPGSTP